MSSLLWQVRETEGRAGQAGEGPGGALEHTSHQVTPCHGSGGHGPLPPFFVQYIECSVCTCTVRKYVQYSKRGSPRIADISCDVVMYRQLDFFHQPHRERSQQTKKVRPSAALSFHCTIFSQISEIPMVPGLFNIWYIAL